MKETCLKCSFFIQGSTRETSTEIETRTKIIES